MFAPAMKSFLRNRGTSLTMVVLILFATSLAQGAISYTMTLGALRGLLPSDVSLFGKGLIVLRFGLVTALSILWLFKLKRALFQLIILVNAWFTLGLLGQTSGLIATLFGSGSPAVRTLLLDVGLMAVSNILIFSIWYWIIDPPGVEEVTRAGEPWDFLFPQRGSSLPHYESWSPLYADYLFVAFTTSFAFSPTDVLPLTRRAKLLMLLQAAISVVSLTAIAGSAINILAGGK
ncbi:MULTISPECIES: hypothetical protein [Bradyrhizobium]|uniref:DUF1345 domain-containing protein n=1 Tax=Bradyrhizobium arachidis TaxID=858423 RepID=A0AAE7NMT3_9BRAD|nr:MULTISPECIES: hypothetical protein [Bradyrhizobium]QOG21231.1 hypothetical protein FOM02_31870 [Bradyrhizobium sp. SEMIA]QOZ67055.1 hypothetical protein WN72_12570 [Bradyrhizobium arachidis]UFW51767.1 hypothetical protein BaraCB756_12640 [Bradyrhizobium arachidis]SFV16978.1 hypothetical protein SAMN05192541_1273 [Bradyrhizobium arachidis]